MEEKRLYSMKKNYQVRRREKPQRKFFTKYDELTKSELTPATNKIRNFGYMRIYFLPLVLLFLYSNYNEMTSLSLYTSMS